MARPERGRAAEVSEPEERPSFSPTVARLTYLLVGLYALTFASLSVWQHDSLRTNAFDLGNMDQAVWNTLQGRWFQFTNWEGGTSRLAAHVEPILLLVAQFYRLYSSPKTLLVLQAVVSSLGALPAFWLARERLRSDFAGLAFAAAYLLAPALQASNLQDFHPVALSSAFLLFAFYFVSKGWYLPFGLMALLAMSTKEQIPLAVFLMGLYVAVVQRRRLVGGVAAGVALLWFALAVGVVIPSFNVAGASPYLSRYEYLGSSPGEVIGRLFTQREAVAGVLLLPAKLDYLVGLLAPLAFLSLLSPVTLLFALPDLAVNLLSNFPWMYSGRAHYSAAIVPILLISAVYGLGHLRDWVGRLSPRGRAPVTYLLSLAVLFASVASYYGNVFLPLSENLPEVTRHARLAGKFVAMIPPEAGVSASSALNPHVSERERLYLFPRVEDAEYVFLDVSASPYPVDHPTQRWKVTELLDSGRWGVLAAEDGFLLLRRGAASSELPDELYSFARAEGVEAQHRIEVAFGDSLRLLGYRVQPQEVLRGQTATASVITYWEPSLPPSRDYEIVVFVVSDDGEALAAKTGSAATTWYPTSRWMPGETLRVELADISLEGRKQGTLWLGVLTVNNPGDFGARVRPLVEGDASAVQLNEDGTLVKLADLRVE